MMIIVSTLWVVFAITLDMNPATLAMCVAASDRESLGVERRDSTLT